MKIHGDARGYKLFVLLLLLVFYFSLAFWRVVQLLVCVFWRVVLEEIFEGKSSSVKGERQVFYLEVYLTMEVSK